MPNNRISVPVFNIDKHKLYTNINNIIVIGRHGYLIIIDIHNMNWNEQL